MAALLENQVATGATAFFPGSQSQQSPDDDGSQITTAGDDNDSDEGNNADRVKIQLDLFVLMLKSFVGYCFCTDSSLSFFGLEQ